MNATCLFCGSGLSIPANEITTVRCSSCGRENDLSDGNATDSKGGGTTLPLSQSLSPTNHTLPKISRRQLGDYEILSEISRGGMGVVYRATQKKLNRLVALKTILPGGQGRPEVAARFQKEAEAAAKLDHPGIVPVYEVGEADGLWFYSMAYIDGDSLDRLAKKSPLSNRESAELMSKVCDAIEFAHKEGILHRDLKPHNILIDEKQGPRVADFGLAKTVEGESELTATGMVLGTPSYMPPEQARGEINQLGPAADVYSLGAILYFLLTGSPPFQSPNAVETIRQVIDNDPPSPRSINAKADQDLETICLKCLRKEASKRYASAQELKDDLDRYLRGEPIHARPFGYGERLQRWSKRNPRVAGLAASVFLSLVAGTVVSSVFAVEASNQARLKDQEAGRANDKANEAVKAKDEAERKSLIAEQQSELALSTVTGVIFDIQTKLRTIPEARQAQQEMLQEAKGNLLKVAETLDSERVSSYALCQIHMDLGQIFSELSGPGDVESETSAERQFELAIRVARDWLEKNPRDPIGQNNLCMALHHFGDQLYERGEVDLAEEHFREALEVAESMDVNERPRLRASALQGGYLYLGRVLESRGKAIEALEAYQLADALTEDGFMDQGEGDRLNMRNVVLESLFQAHLDVGDRSAAEETLQEKLTVNQRLLRLYPDRVEPITALAWTMLNVATIEAENQNYDDAIAHFEESQNLYRRAIELDPGSWSIRLNLASSLSTHGAVLLERDEPVRALPLFQESLELRQTVATRAPNSITLRTNLATSQVKLSGTYLQLGNENQVDLHWDEASKALEELVAQNPNDLNVRSDLLRSFGIQSAYLKKYGAYDKASTIAARALEIGREKADVFSQHPRLSVIYANAIGMSGLVELRLGHVNEALELLLEARAAYENTRATNPEALLTAMNFIIEVEHAINECNTLIAFLDNGELPPAADENGEQLKLELDAKRASIHEDLPELAHIAKELADHDEGNGVRLFEAACLLGHAIQKGHGTSDPEAVDNDEEQDQESQVVAWLLESNNRGCFDEHPDFRLWLPFSDYLASVRGRPELLAVTHPDQQSGERTEVDTLGIESYQHYTKAGEFRNKGELESASQEFQLARQKAERALAIKPDANGLLDLLGFICYKHGDVLSSLKDPQAEAVYRRGIQIWMEYVSRDPTSEHYLQLGGIRHQLATQLLLRDEHDEAVELYLQAVQSQKNALNVDPDNEKSKRFMSFHLKQICEISVLQGNHSDAVMYSNEYSSLYPTNASNQFDAALIMVQSLDLVESDESISESERERLAKRYFEEAIALLTQCDELGVDLRLYKEDPRLARIVDEEAFLELLED